MSSNGYVYCKFSPYFAQKRKRCLDVLICLSVMLPAVVVMLMISIVMLVVDGKPIFFIQWRVGKDGRLFRIVKFRTLRSTKFEDKPSRFGRLLRQHRLDELPQLFNVLLGQMSLVGPRPELPEIVSGYQVCHQRRLRVKPGLTGLWQIKASRAVPIHCAMKFDLYYLRKANLMLDVKILVQTLWFVLRK